MRPQGRQLGGICQIVGAAPTHGVCRPRERRAPLHGIPEVDISHLPSAECEISRLATLRCRRHSVNLFDYLKDLFTRLPAAKITEIRQFTPSQWAKTQSSRLAAVA